jgi:hypothetical protein
MGHNKLDTSSLVKRLTNWINFFCNIQSKIC